MLRRFQHSIAGLNLLPAKQITSFVDFCVIIVIYADGGCCKNWLVRVFVARIKSPVFIVDFILWLYDRLGSVLFNFCLNALSNFFITFVIIVKNIVQRILLVVSQTVEESDLTFSICAHKSEKLWDHVTFVLFDLDLIRKNKFQKHRNVFGTLVQAEQHFGFLVVHVAQLFVVTD